MRTDAQSRIMSLSFKREPEEHADVMIQAGRRMMTPRKALSVGPFFAAAIAVGVVLALGMEAYRRFVLSPLLGNADVTPANVIFLQFLPLFVLAIILIYSFSALSHKRRRQALIERLDKNLFVDVDIYEEGMRSTSGPVTVMLEWKAIRDVAVKPSRLEFEGDSYVAYLPQRAFESRARFEEAAKKIRGLWMSTRHGNADQKTKSDA